MTAATIEPGKLDIAHVIQQLFGVLGRNFTTFFVLALLLYGLPSALVALLNADSLARLQAGDFSAFGPSMGLGWLVAVVTGAILQGALIYGTVEDLNGRRASISDSLATGLRAFLPLIGVSILMALGLAVGFMLLVVPGFMLLCAWIVAVPALIADRTGVTGAFGRSAELTRGNRWRIFGLLVIWMVASLVVSMVVGAVAGVAAFAAGGPASPVTIVINALVTTVTTLVGATGTAVLYVELRKAREGLGGEWLASVFS